MRTVLVTGASSGIGEATVRKMLAAGHTVFAGARRVDRMNSLAEAGAHPLELDVTDDRSLTKAVAAVLSASGRLDVLVNNAGQGSYGALEDVLMAEARYQFDVNLFGLARLTQLVLPTMREQRSGLIVNVSSVGGTFSEPFGGWYHASKFAVEGLSDALRMEVRQFGIDVSVIQPGAIVSEWHEIAREGLVRRSGDGAYGVAAHAYARFMKTAIEGWLPSPPSVVAKAILRATQARRPKPRYAVGGGARLLLAARRMLPDRAFDALMLKGTR